MTHERGLSPRARPALQPADMRGPSALLLSALADESPIAQLGDRLLQLGLGVHHDRAIPRNRLLDRLARDQQEPDALVAGLHRDLVPAVEQHERAVAGALADQGLSALAFLLGQDAERLRRIAERP